jgi:hypothetical protein
MARARTSRPATKGTTATNASSALLGAGAASVASSAVGANTPVLSTCPPEDTTFMCKLTRFYNSTKMILSLVIIFAVILGALWFAYAFFKKR